MADNRHEGGDWPPATVQTPLGEEPFERAVRWHMPTMLRWLDHNQDACYMPSGDLVGTVLRAAANALERADFR